MERITLLGLSWHHSSGKIWVIWRKGQKLSDITEDYGSGSCFMALALRVTLFSKSPQRKPRWGRIRVAFLEISCKFIPKDPNVASSAQISAHSYYLPLLTFTSIYFFPVLSVLTGIAPLSIFHLLPTWHTWIQSFFSLVSAILVDFRWDGWNIYHLHLLLYSSSLWVCNHVVIFWNWSFSNQWRSPYVRFDLHYHLNFVLNSVANKSLHNLLLSCMKKFDDTNIMATSIVSKG